MNSNGFQDSISSAARLISESQKAVVFTGAGISTPSGIPDFRSPGTGLWEHFDPMEILSLTSFRKNPEKFYSWLKDLLITTANAQPNPAHLALAQMEKVGKLRAVITQNIDGLHQKAGSMHVIELHGSLQTATCLNCQQEYAATPFTQALVESGTLPRCPTCQNLLKPAITLYEEMLPEKAWQDAEALCSQADLMMIIGSSLEVIPAAHLPEIAVRNQARLIIINYSPTHLDTYADVLLPYNAAAALPALVQEVLG